MNLNQPVVSATEVVINKLGVNYLLNSNDIVWMNYVHLVAINLRNLSKDQTYQFYIRSAIERLIIDQAIVKHDPYELWIDAGFFDTKLNEIYIEAPLLPGSKNISIDTKIKNK